MTDTFVVHPEWRGKTDASPPAHYDSSLKSYPPWIYFLELGRWNPDWNPGLGDIFPGHGFRHQYPGTTIGRIGGKFSVQLFVLQRCPLVHGRWSLPHLSQYFPRNEPGGLKSDFCANVSRATNAAAPHSALCPRPSGSGRLTGAEKKYHESFRLIREEKRAPHRLINNTWILPVSRLSRQELRVSRRRTWRNAFEPPLFRSFFRSEQTASRLRSISRR